METKKSIQDIKVNNQNTISDIIPSIEQSPIKKRARKTITKTKIEPDTVDTVDTIVDDTIYEEVDNIPMTVEEKKVKTSTLTYKKFMRLIYQIKPAYLIILVLIILSSIILLILPNSANKKTLEQSKVEAEMVKKQLSRHIMLPQNEQIDIRKITNKMEDPFFKDASVGDYLIILYKNRIAYIFSVDKDIIINAGVVFIDPKTATTTSTTTATTTKTKQ